MAEIPIEANWPGTPYPPLSGPGHKGVGGRDGSTQPGPALLSHIAVRNGGVSDRNVRHNESLIKKPSGNQTPLYVSAVIFSSLH